jgi:8-oxo-dGTP diphosphatase
MGEDGTADAAIWADRFPELFRPRYESYANADLEFRLGEPPDEEVARLHVVGVDARGRVVVCRSVEGWRFLPGGRRERGESLAQVSRRELREEAGCSVLGEPGSVFAYERATSRNPEPHHPHFTHPVSAWAYAVARVEVTGPPTNPPDGESVVEVLALPPAEAVAWLAVWEEVEHAQVVALADAMGLLSRPPD